ncbi:30S ribosomal protein S1 [Streptomyces noursei]|uniref:30S ribosomal protein S1 n=1 Tax=Streptomyces noursei TaxID=1971 RepID=A0A2N8PEH3_STRNR|nr:30S ribosomal protein S1 [Streptomyces noursei]
MVTEEEWDRIRGSLRLGQIVEGTVVAVPRPGAIGVFVDIGLSVGGFVDVVLLPDRSELWPTVGTVTGFEIWWAHRNGRQIRLKPADPRYLCADFDDFVARFRPGWPSEIGSPISEPTLPSP